MKIIFLARKKNFHGEKRKKKPWSKKQNLAPGLIVSHKRFCGD